MEGERGVSLRVKLLYPATQLAADHHPQQKVDQHVPSSWKVCRILVVGFSEESKYVARNTLSCDLFQPGPEGEMCPGICRVRLEGAS